MSLNHYKLFIEQVFQFAETIVIKSEGSASSINDRLISMYGNNAVNPINKKSWKYYLNLSGQYHTTDKKITITSLDTLENIELNIQNLKIHTATAKAYQYGTRYYRELVNQYPDHEQLILGILYPVNIDKAIEAPDFSVLGYPAKYVEENEESLIPNINKWLQNYKTRWYNIQYNLSDNLYLASVLGIMYHQLVPLILTLRLRACKTNEAHSFDVREYLASHCMLNEYLDQMTKKQALFFYRNINYIERNPGKVETFDWLLENILTQRDVPVSEINLSQDETELLTSYKPKSRFLRNPINSVSSTDAETTAFYTLAELLAKERNQAPGNGLYIDQNYNTIDNKIARSKTNFLKTKVLESKMIDYSDVGLYSIQDVAIDLWCYTSGNKKYNAVINFTDKTTNQDIALDNHVAFLYFIYAYCQVYDVPLVKVPEFFINRVAISPVPTIQDLAKVVDKNYVSEEDLAYLISLHTGVENSSSTSAFNDYLLRSHTSYKAENMFAFTQNHIYKKALIKNASYRLYRTSRVITEYTGKTFNSIFTSYNLPINGLSKDEWSDIYRELFEQATGVKLNLTDAKAAMQAAMINLFKKLSSYSIQFISDINRTTIKSINWSSLRMGSVERYGEDLKHLQLAIIKIFSKMSSSKDYRLIELKNMLQSFYITTKLDLNFIDATINAWQSKPSIKRLLDINVIRPDINKSETCLLAAPEQLPQFKPYFDLSLSDKEKVRCIYRDYTTDEDFIPQIDIENIEHVTRSLGTNYINRSTDQLRGFKYHYVPNSFEFRVDRDSTELDAFFSNFGDLNSKAFTPFIGFKKNNRSFKLVDGPLDTFVKSFSYTGGIRYNPGFGYSENLAGDMDLGSMKLIKEPTVDTGMLFASFDTRMLNFFYNTKFNGISLGSYFITLIKTEVGLINFIVDKRTIESGTLLTGTEQVDIAFNSNIVPTYNMNFTPVFSSYDLGDYSIDVGYYDIGSYYMDHENVIMNMQLNYGLLDIGSPTYITHSTVLPDSIMLIDTITDDNIFFAAGNWQLGIYSYSSVNEDLLKYKWTEHDIDALLANWEDLDEVIEDITFTESPVEELDIIYDVFIDIELDIIYDVFIDIELDIIYDVFIDIELDIIYDVFIDIELGIASYDNVNKEINFS